MSSVANPPPKESSAAFSTAVRAEVDAAAVPFVEEEGSIVAKVIVEERRSRRCGSIGCLFEKGSGFLESIFGANN